MLIVLPPSQGKTAAVDGPDLDIGSLPAPALNPTRTQLVRAVERLCSHNAASAAQMLKLGKTRQGEIIDYNARLSAQPTARADSVYTGVLYDELDPASMTEAVRAEFDAHVLIASALFGFVRPYDRIPAYRLIPEVSLPRLGTVASRWRPLLPQALSQRAGDDLVLDLRSGSYQQMGAPDSALVQQTATIRVLQERGDTRSVVSHFNKAYKGRIVRQLLESGAAPRHALELFDCLADLGWHVEKPSDSITKTGLRLDVII